MGASVGAGRRRPCRGRDQSAAADRVRPDGGGPKLWRLVCAGIPCARCCSGFPDDQSLQLRPAQPDAGRWRALAPGYTQHQDTPPHPASHVEGQGVLSRVRRDVCGTAALGQQTVQESRLDVPLPRPPQGQKDEVDSRVGAQYLVFEHPDADGGAVKPTHADRVGRRNNRRQYRNQRVDQPTGIKASRNAARPQAQGPTQ